jgi:hypothetical protein
MSSATTTAAAPESEEPKVCQVCGKPGPRSLSVRVCDEDYQPGYKALVDLVLGLREKKKPGITAPSPTAIPSDKYRINFLYQSLAETPEMWYFDMKNPIADSKLTNEENAGLKHIEIEDAWESSGTKEKAQVRLQGQILPKSVDIEGTIYAKYVEDYVPSGESPGPYWFQFYRGGGRHSTSDAGLGCAYKLRLKKDGSVYLCKEIIHPEYTSNRGGVIGSSGTRKLSSSAKGHYVGMKLVTFNLPEQKGIVPVQIEGYVDEEGMDDKGVLHPEKQNWKLMAQTIDDGNWSAGSESVIGKYPPVDMKNGTGKRQPDEILNMPGGPKEGNVIAYRTDHARTRIKDMSWRKIKPLKVIGK